MTEINLTEKKPEEIEEPEVNDIEETIKQNSIQEQNLTNS